MGAPPLHLVRLLGKADVGKLGIALEVEQHIGRFDVTVQDDGPSRRRRVQEDECTHCIAHRPQPLLPRQGRPHGAGRRQERSQAARRVVIADQPVFEAAARHQRVDEAADAALVAEGEQRQQVLVPASAEQLHLAHQLIEPLLAVRGKALDCHRPQHGPRRQRVCPVHYAEAALAHLAGRRPPRRRCHQLGERDRRRGGRLHEAWHSLATLHLAPLCLAPLRLAPLCLAERCFVLTANRGYQMGAHLLNLLLGTRGASHVGGRHVHFVADQTVHFTPTGTKVRAVTRLLEARGFRLVAQF